MPLKLQHFTRFMATLEGIMTHHSSTQDKPLRNSNSVIDRLSS